MGKWTYLCVNNDKSVNLYKKNADVETQPVNIQKR